MAIAGLVLGYIGLAILSLVIAVAPAGSSDATVAEFGEFRTSGAP